MDPKTASWNPVHVAGDFHCENQADAILSMPALRFVGQNTNGRNMVAASSGRYLAAESGTQPPQFQTYSGLQRVPEEDEIETDYSGQRSSRFPSLLLREGDLSSSHMITALHEVPNSSNHMGQQQHKV